MQFATAQPLFKLAAPVTKAVESVGIKTQQGWSILLQGCADGYRVEVGEAAEDLPRLLPGQLVWRSIDLSPVAADIWPDQQPEALQQAIVTGTTLQGGAHISGQSTRLGRTEQRQAQRRDVQVKSASDAVEGVAAVAVPGGELKTPGGSVIFTIEPFQQRHDFIPVDQQPVRVLAQELAQGFDTAVAADVAFQMRRFRGQQ